MEHNSKTEELLIEELEQVVGGAPGGTYLPPIKLYPNRPIRLPITTMALGEEEPCPAF